MVGRAAAVPAKAPAGKEKNWDKAIAALLGPEVWRAPERFDMHYMNGYEFEQHLGRLTSYLESSYLKISTALKHEMPEPIPVIFYKTHSEFEQTNLFPAFIPEGVAAFTEPVKNRMVLPIDEPPDQLQGLITHEMVHAFAFDLIPRGIGFGISQTPIPLWVDEGLADYLRGIWEPLDLMMIRDAALTDQVPRLSEAAFQPLSGRLVYNLGHAAFEFIESRYGKEGIRQFLYSMRKGILGGSTEDLFKQAFRTTPEEFDNEFDKWLKERFKPYRDLQRPSDFGRDLSPDIRKGPFTQAYAFSPSPSGEIAAVLTVHTGDGEGDVVLVSTRDGKVIKNLTFTSDGFAIEAEMTVKIARAGYRVYETPISYSGRDYSEGKKITWKDAFPTLWALIKHRFFSLAYDKCVRLEPGKDLICHE